MLLALLALTGTITLGAIIWEGIQILVHYLRFQTFPLNRTQLELLTSRTERERLQNRCNTLEAQLEGALTKILDQVETQMKRKP